MVSHVLSTSSLFGFPLGYFAPGEHVCALNSADAFGVTFLRVTTRLFLEAICTTTFY